MHIKSNFHTPQLNKVRSFLDRRPLSTMADSFATAVADRVALRTSRGRDDIPTNTPILDQIKVPREAFTDAYVRRIAQEKGNAPITFLSSPIPRKEQSHNIAETFRMEDNYGLVIDPLEMEVAGWSDSDYANHWRDVRKAFKKDMQLVLGPGWKDSRISQNDIADAKKLGIPIKKIEIKDLTRTDIEIRLAESEQELIQRGYSTPAFVATLNGAVDQDYLKDKATGSFTTDDTFDNPVGYVSDVVARTLNGRHRIDNDGAKQAGKMPQSEFTDLYVEQAKKQLDGRPMVYVSTPITGGRKKFDLFDNLGVKDKAEFDKSAKDRFVKDVIVANTNRAFRISESLRQENSNALVMDPSEITIPEWSQSHYAAHWDAVVKELASKVVLAPGWDFSSGCILEIKRALDKGVPVQEVVVSPVAASELE